MGAGGVGHSEPQVTGPHPPDSCSPTDRAALGGRGRSWPQKGPQWEMFSPGTGVSGELLDGPGVPTLSELTSEELRAAGGCGRGQKEEVGVCRYVTAHRLGMLMGSVPLAVMTCPETLVTVPQPSCRCRAGLVGFCLPFFHTRGKWSRYAMKTGHTRDAHGAEGGVRTPGGTSHHLGNPLPTKLCRGVNFQPTPQRPQSPFWKDTGSLQGAARQTPQKNKQGPRANPVDHRPVAVSPRALPWEAPRPPNWAGLFRPQGWERPGGGPEAPRGAKHRVSVKAPTWTESPETPSLHGDPGSCQE